MALLKGPPAYSTQHKHSCDSYQAVPAPGCDQQLRRSLHKQQLNHQVCVCSKQRKGLPRVGWQWRRNLVSRVADSPSLDPPLPKGLRAQQHGERQVDDSESEGEDKVAGHGATGPG